MLRRYNVRTMKKHFLGNLSPRQFLREYWQKKPLLVRNAFPGFSGLLSPQELAGLACLEEAQSRLIVQKGARWQLRNGPFDDDDFTRLPRTKWSLLVQGINHFLPEAERLLQEFDFVPHARLDDMMVSYAPKGGSVGPHFDSYDVFLLQGLGHRATGRHPGAWRSVENPAALPSGAGVDFGTGRHAVPTAALCPFRHRTG